MRLCIPEWRDDDAKGIDMSVIGAIGVAAGVALIAAFACRSQIKMRLLALTSNVLFIGYAAMLDLAPFLILNILLLPVNLWRLKNLFNTRRPTQKTWKMDADVHEKVRDIQAYSRYDSAGIEF